MSKFVRVKFIKRVRQDIKRTKMTNDDIKIIIGSKTNIKASLELA